MRICIDSIGSQLLGTGLGTFTNEFLTNLLYMYPQPIYDLLYDSLNFEINTSKNKKVYPLNLNINRLDNDYSKIEKHITSNKVDIYHSPNNGFSLPQNKTCNYITTVQNLLPVVNAKYVDDKYLDKFKNVFDNVIKNSDKIIVLSEFLREQLRNYFDVPDKKIAVIYPGCSTIFNPKNQESCDNILSSKYKVKGEYILCVGSIHRRKNLENLIRAFKYINIGYKGLKLVLVGNYQGKRKQYFEEIKNLIQDLNLVDSIIFTGIADYNDMPYLYSKARCVINLSKYEGFPLSSIEAMACNTPVIWNDTSFFREAFGKAGIAVDAYNNDSIVNGISEAIFNNSLKDAIIDRQKEISSRYKWGKNIVNTVRVYEEFF